MNSKRLYFFLVFIFAIKLIAAAVFPLFGDEAYYYIWSQHLQLSYFDHPAMVSWLIKLSHFVFNEGTLLGVRFPFILLSFLSSLIWFKILKLKNFSYESIFYFFVFLVLNPLLGIGSILATPDVPLVFFWSLSYLFYLNIFEKRTLSSYAFLGVSLGLGFCSKYHIVIFVISGLLHIFLTGLYKKIRLSGVFVTLLTGGLFSLPVIIWNAQNEWQSFLFQLNHGFGEPDFEWSRPVGYLVAQSLIVNPFILPALFKQIRGNVDKIFSLSQLGFFFTSSFKSVVEGNWPLTSHFHSIGAFVSDTAAPLKKALIYWSVFYTLIVVFMISPASQKVRSNLVNSAQLNELYPLVNEYEPLYAPSYQVASLMTWKTQKAIAKLNQLSRRDFYDSLPDSVPNEKVFYALKYTYNFWPEQYVNYKKIKIRSFDNINMELYQFINE